MPRAYDAHIHMALTGSDYKAALARHAGAPDDEAIRCTLAAYRAAGVSYLRDGGDKYGACTRAAQLAPAYGIEYASPAFPLFQIGNYGAFIGRGFHTVADACALVDEALESGAAFIKLMASGILDFERFGVLTGYGLDEDLLDSLIAYAHSCDVPVMVHVNGAKTVAAALEAGADSIEHAFYLDDATARLLAESAAIWVPTLAPICNARACGSGSAEVLEAIAEHQMRMIRRVAELGGIIACGSDAGAGAVPHVRGAADEYALLTEALGAGAEAVLARGCAELMRRFPA